MNAYTIRRATPADVHEIKAIEMGTPTAAHWPAEEYLRSLEPGGIPRIVLIVDQREQIAGFIVMRCIDIEWELENIAVAQVFRRQGLGRALIQNAFALAREQKASRMFLEVRESNQPARSLYSQLGFRETGRRPAYYSHPIEDAITYEIVIEI